MELVATLNDVVELAVELASEGGVETFLDTPGAHLQHRQKGSDEDQAASSSLVISSSSDGFSRQLDFNKEWRQCRREARGAL